MCTLDMVQYIYVRVCVCVSVSVSVYGPFYRSGVKTGWKYFEILYVLVPKLCPYIYCTISKVHISSKLTVNFYIVFSECVGMFFLSQKLSLPKHSNKL